MPGREIFIFNRARIIALNEAGFSNHYKSVILNISRATVSRINHRYEETGTVQRMPRIARISTEREDRYLMQFTRQNQNATAQTIRAHFQGKFHRIISTSTTRRQLYSANLRARRVLRVSQIPVGGRT